MIVFDLKCSQNHVFEGWFDSIDAFEEQNAKKMVTCPYCDDSQVKRIMSPVALRKASPEDTPATPPVHIDYQKLAMEIVQYFQTNFEDVGTRFAGEALKIHYGASEKRNIRGSATLEEEKILKKEGV